MRQSQYRRVLTGVTFATALSMAFGATAQVTGNPPGAPAAPVVVDPAAQATQARMAQRPIPAEFGITNDSILQIHASAFTPRTPTATFDYVTNTEVIGNNTAFSYWAPVNLPEGAVIDFLDLYGCDTSATSHMTLYLTGYSGESAPAFNDFWFMSSAQITSPVSGCGYWISIPTPSPFVINNNVIYQGGYQYVVNLAFGVASTANRFRSADIWWHRQVSPAPATASFGDVPTSHPYFQFIEALRASGITTGCGSGANYCPGDPLTRGQMAVFLAKALGLHWPY